MHRHLKTIKAVTRRGRRWVGRSRLQRQRDRQFMPIYWYARSQRGSIRFWVDKNRFAAYRWLRARRESTSIFSSILKTVLTQVLLAVIVVAALQGIDHLQMPRMVPTVLHWMGVHLPDISGIEHSPSGIRLPKPPAIHLDAGMYTTILSTLAQIAGIFLGLYFTAVSVVLSTAYAHVPGDVRALLTQDRIGQVYIKAVALLCAIAVMMLALADAGLPPTLLDLLAVVALGVVAILSFVNLGTRVFFFFDPLALAGYLERDIVRQVNLATPEGFGWHDPSFQAAYQREAGHLLTTYQTITRLATEGDYLHGQAIARLGGKALLLLEHYATRKICIPSQSRWFRQTLRHRRWLTSDDIVTNMALSTRTPLQPEVVPDLLWLETEITPVVVRSLSALLTNQDRDGASFLLGCLQHTLNRLSEQLAIDEARGLLRAMRETVQTRMAHLSADAEQDDADVTLGALDMYGASLITLILGFRRTLQTLSTDVVTTRLDRVRWRRSKDIYLTGMPRAVVRELEDLRECLLFEYEVEARFVTPAWFLNNLVIHSLMCFVATSLEQMIEDIEETVVADVQRLVGDQHYPYAMQLIQRGWEACCRYIECLGASKRRVDEWVAAHRPASGSLPIVPWDALADRVHKAHDDLVAAVAQIAPSLQALPASDKRPDYFGLAHTILAQECVAAMNGGNEGLFATIFPAFFNSCLDAYSRTHNELRDRDSMVRYAFSIDPIADLLELSGYAYIYSALDGKGYWRVAKRLWDTYVAAHPEQPSLLGFIGRVVDFSTGGGPVGLPGTLRRIRWKRELEQYLQQKRLLPDDTALWSPDHEPRHDQHSDPAIRVLTQHAYYSTLMYDPTDVFLVTYLRGPLQACGIALSRGAESFAETLDRQTEHATIGGENGDAD